ncbi:DUF2975 domain-containing protein [Shewanella sp. NIFS-20-20]|uniref:DUF2975 domain-containing protein n=1 Tax=Shewanella sp. NIFS-20-20 TaxID=2853806 RepID=UPI001C479512|nr:DUF2975 domain-containing protein [Shewanella sp. NIFS-20-20]MBV7314543.1 DUF2975 domain-containing protein [Shewanella sp. NIFS-20-20]
MNGISQKSALIQAVLLLLFLLNLIMFLLGVSHSTMAYQNNLELDSLAMFFNRSIDGIWGDYSMILQQHGWESFWFFAPFKFVFQQVVILILWQLFGCFKQNEIFTHNTVRKFKILGVILLSWVCFLVLYPLVISLALSALPNHERVLIVFSISEDEFFLLLIGILIYIVANIFQEALDLKLEQDLVI